MPGGAPMSTGNEGSDNILTYKFYHPNFFFRLVISVFALIKIKSKTNDKKIKPPITNQIR